MNDDKLVNLQDAYSTRWWHKGCSQRGQMGLSSPNFRWDSISERFSYCCYYWHSHAYILLTYKRWEWRRPVSKISFDRKSMPLTLFDCTTHNALNGKHECMQTVWRNANIYRYFMQRIFVFRSCCIFFLLRLMSFRKWNVGLEVFVNIWSRWQWTTFFALLDLISTKHNWGLNLSTQYIRSWARYP